MPACTMSCLVCIVFQPFGQIRTMCLLGMSLKGCLLVSPQNFYKEIEREEMYIR